MHEMHTKKNKRYIVKRYSQAWSQKCSNLDLGWVKVMCGEFGEHFLAVGTLFLNSHDTLSYQGIHAAICQPIRNL